LSGLDLLWKGKTAVVVSYIFSFLIQKMEREITWVFSLGAPSSLPLVLYSEMDLDYFPFE